MRLGAAQNGGVKKPRAGQIADIGSLASEEPPILEALDGTADITVNPHLLPICGPGLRSPLRYYNDLILSSASVRLSRHAGGGRILGYDEHGLPADGYPHLGHHCCVVDGRAQPVLRRRSRDLASPLRGKSVGSLDRGRKPIGRGRRPQAGLVALAHRDRGRCDCSGPSKDRAAHIQMLWQGSASGRSEFRRLPCLRARQDSSVAAVLSTSRFPANRDYRCLTAAGIDLIDRAPVARPPH